MSNDNFSTIFEINLFSIKNVKINGMRNKKEYNFLSKLIPNHMEDIEQRKIQKVKIMNYSPTIWMLSPPTINHIIRIIDKNVEVYIKFKWDFIRDYPVNNKNVFGTSKKLLNRDEIKILKDIISSIKTKSKSPLIRSKLTLNGKN